MPPKPSNQVGELAQQFVAALQTYINGTAKDRDRLVKEHGPLLGEVQYLTQTFLYADRSLREEAVEAAKLSGMLNASVEAALQKPNIKKTFGSGKRKRSDSED